MLEKFLQTTAIKSGDNKTVERVSLDNEFLNLNLNSSTELPEIDIPNHPPTHQVSVLLLGKILIVSD